MMPRRILSASSVHLIGIGGTGMSGLALILRRMGKSVTGSDRTALPGDLALAMRAAGIAVAVGHAAGNLPAGAGAAVASAAIPDGNPERVEAARRGLPVLKYAQALAEVARGRRQVAVSGTHGKTTTTGWIAWILERSGLSGSFLVGGVVEGIGVSAGWGAGDWFVLEACEYDRSFLNYEPDVSVVTNVDADHMDYYKTFDAVQAAFREFVGRAAPGGTVLLSAEDPSTPRLREAARAKVQTTGLSGQADWRAAAITPTEAGFRFRLSGPGGDLGEFRIGLAGMHNVRNALQAAAAAIHCGADLSAVREHLAGFPGVQRRTQVIGTVRGAPVISDYAHHPVELAATFQALRQRFPGRMLRVVFQPHQYSRTAYLFDDFVKALSSSGGPDELILAPIYGARRDGQSPEATSDDLARAIRAAGGDCRLIGAFDGIVEDLARAISPDDLVAIVGAGDIVQVAEALVEKHGERTGRFHE